MAVTFERSFGNVRRTYTVYASVDEAVAAGISEDSILPSWRYARKAGGWALTDDGYVAQVVRVRDYVYKKKDRPGAYVSFNVVLTAGEGWVRFHRGTGVQDGKATLNARELVEHPDGPVARWRLRERTRARTASAVRVLARVMVVRKPTEEDYAFIGNIYRPGQRRPDKTLKRFLRTPEAKTMLEAEIAALFERAGVPPTKVIQHQDEIRQAAVELGTVGSLKLAHEVTLGWVEMLGLKPKELDANGLPPHEYDTIGGYESYVQIEGAPDDVESDDALARQLLSGAPLSTPAR